MADMMENKVRLTGESGQLVGQLNNVAAAEGRVAESADKATAAGQRAAAGAARLEAAEARKAKALADADAAQNRAALSALKLAAAQERAGQTAVKTNQAVTGSLGAVRAGQMQAGQQVQDFFIQVQGGQSILTAFTQQASQLTGALSLMASGGAATTGVMGRFISFMGGPWGIVLGAAIPIVALLTRSLFENEQATKAVEVAADNTATAQSLLGKMFDLNTGKIKNNTAALRDNIYMNMVAMQQKAIIARTEAEAALNESGAGKTTGWQRFSQRLMAIASQNPARMGAVEQNLARQEAGARQYESLGRGVAQGGMTREEAGKILESRRKEIGDDQYFALQNMLNRSAEEFSANKAVKDLQTALGGKLPDGFLDPKADRKRRGGGGDEAAKLKQLEKFGESAAEKIMRINEAFDEQPKLVDRVNQSSRELDAIIKELSERKPVGWQEMVKDAQAAKETVRKALVQPFNEMVEASGRQRDVQSLILAGREDEAKALQQIYQLQDKVGFVTRDQREAILANVKAEDELNKKLAQRQQLVNAYTGAIADARTNLEGLLGGTLSGGDFLKNMRQSMKQLQGKLLAEQFFGPALRELEEEVKKKTGIQSSVDIMKEGVTDAGHSASDLAGSLEAAARRVDNLFQPNMGGGATGSAGAAGAGVAGLGSVVAAIGAGSGAFNTASSAAQQTADGVQDIVVTAKKLERGPMGMTIDQFYRRQADIVTAPFLQAADKIFGGTFFQDKLGPVLSGVWSGYNQGGIPGAVLGGLQEIKGLPDKLSGAIGKGFKGAQTGSMVAGIGKSLGLNMSTTGSQIGGAIGAALPIPGGDIIGSILGGVVGGLFKKKPYGTAVLTGTGDPTITGNKGAARDAANSMAEAVTGSLASLAERLGGSLGAYNVSIGTYKGKARVSASGKSGKLKGGDVVDFGKGGEEAAVAYAIADAIKDGAITGLSTAMQAAVRANAKDLDKALSEALKVKELEKSLGGFMGSARNAFVEFEAQAKDRLRIATAYGLNINKVEELNAKERIALRKQLEEQSFGSLQDLLTRMRSGDLFEGSAVDQRTAILAEIEKAKDAAARGEEGASDKLANLLEQLNSISRDVYGSTGGYAGDRSQIENTAEGVIALLKAQLDAADPSAAGMEATNSLLDENNTQNAQLLAELKRLGIILTGGNPGTGAPPTTPTTPYNPAFNLGGLAYTGGGSAGVSGGGRFREGMNPLQ